MATEAATPPPTTWIQILLALVYAIAVSIFCYDGTILLMKWWKEKQQQKTDKAASVEPSSMETAEAKKEKVDKEDDETKKVVGDNDDSNKVAQVVTETVKVIDVKEKEKDGDDDSMSLNTPQLKGSSTVVSYEKNFVKTGTSATEVEETVVTTDKAMTGTTTTTTSTTACAIVTDKAYDKEFARYLCPVPGCKYSADFRKMHNPPLSAEGLVRDDERWSQPFMSQIVKMRNHFTKHHPSVPQSEWPAGFAYVRAKKRSAKDEGGTKAKQARTTPSSSSKTATATPKHTLDADASRSSTNATAAKRAKRS